MTDASTPMAGIRMWPLEEGGWLAVVHSSTHLKRRFELSRQARDPRGLGVNGRFRLLSLLDRISHDAGEGCRRTGEGHPPKTMVWV